MFTIEVKGLNDIIKRLPDEKKAKTAVRRAFQRGIKSGKTLAARETAREYAVSKGKVMAAGSEKIGDGGLSAEVSFKASSVNIAEYKLAPKAPRPSKRPVVRVTIKKSSGAQPYKGLFIHPKTGKGFKRTGRKRLPIKAVSGPAVSQLVGSDDVAPIVMDRIEEITAKRLEHEVERMLS